MLIQFRAQQVLQRCFPADLIRLHTHRNLFALRQVTHLDRPIRQTVGDFLNRLAVGMIAAQERFPFCACPGRGHHTVEAVDTQPNAGAQMQLNGSDRLLPEDSAQKRKAQAGCQRRKPENPSGRCLSNRRFGQDDHIPEHLSDFIVQIRHFEKPARFICNDRMAQIAGHDKIFHFRRVLLFAVPFAGDVPG